MELIGRQALIATLGIKEECSECVHKALIYCKLNAANACDAIMNAPTIEAKPKHGRWIPVTNGKGGFECSVCTNYAPSYRDGVEWHSRFCPTCGAKMDLDEVEE